MFAHVLAMGMVGNSMMSSAFGIGTTLTASDIDLLVSLIRIMLLSPIFLGISNIFNVSLQQHRKFLNMMSAPLLYNLSIIAFTILLYRKLGIYSVALAVVVGSFVHMMSQIVTFYGLKITPSNGLIHFKTIIYPTVKVRIWLRSLVKLAVPRSLSLMIEQINVIINTFISLTLSAGALSAYKFAYSLHLFPIHIIASSISMIVMPELTESNSQRNQVKFKENFNIALQQILFLTLPIISVVLVLRFPLVRLAYGTGQFNWWATVITSWRLFFFTLSIMGQSLSALALRAFYALHDTKTPLFVSFFVIIVNVSIGYYMTNFFSHYLDWRPLLHGLYVDLINNHFYGLSTILFSDVKNWLITRNGSDFAVGGLALALGIAFMVEAILYLWILNRKFSMIKKDGLFSKISAWILATSSGYILYHIVI
jgi:murein biosynthesis integral membrane protein MurJ